MKKLLFILLPLAGFFMTSCQNVSVQQKTSVSLNSSLLNDHFFLHEDAVNEIVVETKQQIFALDDNIKHMVATDLLAIMDKRKRAIKLLAQIFNHKNIGLAYQRSANLTASETYYSKQANCLSLTIMAYALAKEAKLNIRFQAVNVPEFWVRNGQYNMLTGHVNLLVFVKNIANKTIIYGSDSMQIDFAPYIANKRFSRRFIDKETVTAMYYNNKAAQAIVDKQYRRAYTYLKAAVQNKPSFSIGWGNLALLYRLNHLHELARKTYLYALELNPNNLTALANYGLLLSVLGEHEKALAIQKKIQHRFIHTVSWSV